ncbi:MAG: hypothetical protein HN742_25260 [Lentisphaerae bacterium]|jgi:hypothetical protein|nr:hypothetical protein [Lentisphaerota bacterium]MBT4816667.1 hypothetical protein [Lentisphaerota bacterium]MBT5607588.1 hypothetical protein [Lentisphaerota bacterium]MBT7054551.1 hypothetical protein [Lentisphaerota bacterium]MBT7845209.1 hypothetical protein [Lentisphaerota bacterium]
MDSDQKQTIPEQVEKLAPFVLRSGIVVVGRERLQQLRAKLNFVWVTSDLSPNSLRKCTETFPCPIVQLGESSDFARLFDLSGTKLIGFRRASLSNNIYAELKFAKLEFERSQPPAGMPTKRKRRGRERPAAE